MSQGQEDAGSTDQSIDQLENKKKANEEIISNLKEFFSSYLSEFLKAYRNPDKDQSEKMGSLLKEQDRIYSKMQDLMKKLEEQQQGSSSASEDNGSEKKGDSSGAVSAEILQDSIQRQERFISIIKEFFTVNSKFMKVYRTMPQDWDKQMEKLLEDQENVCSKLEELALK